jgi:hypothetical protein
MHRLCGLDAAFLEAAPDLTAVPPEQRLRLLEAFLAKVRNLNASGFFNEDSKAEEVGL